MLIEIEKRLRTVTGLTQLDFVFAVEKPKAGRELPGVTSHDKHSAAVVFGIGFVYALLAGLGFPRRMSLLMTSRSSRSHDLDRESAQA